MLTRYTTNDNITTDNTATRSPRLISKLVNYHKTQHSQSRTYKCVFAETLHNHVSLVCPSVNPPHPNYTPRK